MARLIHLNGVPGVGKSTIAKRYAADHPGVLNCDIDVLRTLVGGWRDDFDGVGALIRPAALAMISAYLAGGHDVVLPQMLAREENVVLFRAAATDVGAAHLHIMLATPPAVAAQRFYGRGTADPVHAAIRDVMDAEGGQAAIEGLDVRLARVAASLPGTHQIDASGSADQTYAAVLALTR